MEVREGSEYVTKKGWRTGRLKWWAVAGYFTGPMLPGMRWDRQGRELTEAITYNTMRQTDDIVNVYQEVEDDDQQKESATQG